VVLKELIARIPVDKIAPKIPLLIQSFMFMAASQKVVNVSDPMLATALGVKYVAWACRPQVPYPLKCVVLASQTAITIKSKGSDNSLTLLIAVANQIVRVE